jgi:hypothetical protein
VCVSVSAYNIQVGIDREEMNDKSGHLLIYTHTHSLTHTEYCPRGSLRQMIQNEGMSLCMCVCVFMHPGSGHG